MFSIALFRGLAPWLNFRLAILQNSALRTPVMSMVNDYLMFRLLMEESELRKGQRRQSMQHLQQHRPSLFIPRTSISDGTGKLVMAKRLRKARTSISGANSPRAVPHCREDSNLHLQTVHTSWDNFRETPE